MKLNTLINRAKTYSVDLNHLIRNVPDNVLFKLWMALTDDERRFLIGNFKRNSFDFDLIPPQPPSEKDMSNTLNTVYHLRDNWSVYYFGAVVLECCPLNYVYADAWLLEAQLSLIYRDVDILTTTLFTPLEIEDFGDLIDSYCVKRHLEIDIPATRDIIILLQNYAQGGVVRIGESTIPDIGMGLFAVHWIANGDTISEYGGIYGKQPLRVDSKYVVDPNLMEGGDEFYGLILDGDIGFYIYELGRWANDSLDPEMSNATLLVDHIEDGLFGIDNRPFKVSIQALRDIEPGEEIFVSYGDSYWNHSSVEPKKRRLCIECRMIESKFYDAKKHLNVFCSSKCFDTHLRISKIENK